MEATLLTTKMDWQDLVLNSRTKQSLETIEKWHRFNGKLLQDWDMSKKLNPGYRVLFHGPSGTGKTLSAALLGKQLDLSVYRIDLAAVVSKYIGETEKNLEQIFSNAEGKDWILFFDEADALFGKRTEVKDAHDRYANIEVAYLLQRIEAYEGLSIVATRTKANIDPAFIRRFNLLVEFALPTEVERELLWKKYIPAKTTLAKDVNLSKLAAKYDLNGASILNAVHYASLQAVSKNTENLTKADILEGIRQEYEKEGRELER